MSGDTPAVIAACGFRPQDGTSTDKTLILIAHSHLNRQDRPVLQLRGKCSFGIHVQSNETSLLPVCVFFLAILPKHCFDEVTNIYINMGPNPH